jgi:hypothetical protein
LILTIISSVSAWADNENPGPLGPGDDGVQSEPLSGGTQASLFPDKNPWPPYYPDELKYVKRRGPYVPDPEEQKRVNKRVEEGREKALLACSLVPGITGAGCSGVSAIRHAAKGDMGEVAWDLAGVVTFGLGKWARAARGGEEALKAAEGARAARGGEEALKAAEGAHKGLSLVKEDAEKKNGE